MLLLAVSAPKFLIALQVEMWLPTIGHVLERIILAHLGGSPHRQLGGIS